MSCRDQDGGSKRSYRDLSGVAFPGPGRSEKIAQFYSVLVWSELPNGSNGEALTIEVFGLNRFELL